MVLPSVVEWSHELMRRVLQPGSVCFDATVGNGNDLLMMAACIGNNGLVIGCDIQEHAIQKATCRVRQAGFEQVVRLFVASHEHIDFLCQKVGVSRVNAVMYNLGYLPGGKKSIVTKPNTTYVSLEKALSLLADGGVITIVAYVGHEGGRQEADTIIEWSRNLLPTEFECMMYSSLIYRGAPIGIAIARRLSQ